MSYAEAFGLETDTTPTPHKITFRHPETGATSVAVTQAVSGQDAIEALWDRLGCVASYWTQPLDETWESVLEQAETVDHDVLILN